MTDPSDLSREPSPAPSQNVEELQFETRKLRWRLKHMVKAWETLDTENEKLKAENNSLKAENTELKTKLETEKDASAKRIAKVLTKYIQVSKEKIALQRKFNDYKFDVRHKRILGNAGAANNLRSQQNPNQMTNNQAPTFGPV